MPGGRTETSKVFDYISDILKFSNEISLYEIPKFMKKRIEEKEKLKGKVQELSKKRDELTEIKEEIEQEIQELRNIIKTMSKTYTTITMAKFQLKKYGIEMENLGQFVKCVLVYQRKIIILFRYSQK
jgi:predicted  nucleic acid-binding Zn-ribbon protein